MLTVGPARGKLLRSLDRLPPFSPILNRAMASLAQENVCFNEIADLLEKDTVLAGNILRTVNSAFYGIPREINSVRHAISLVGMQRVRNTVLALSVTRVWRHPAAANGWNAAAFNLHSAATASLSDLLAQRVSVDYPEGAFTAGLFHDLGKLLVASELPRVYEVLRAMDGREESAILECELELAGIHHAELAAEALERWKLPPAIQEAVRLHHTPADGSTGPLSLGQVVRTADRCVRALGLAAAPSAPPGKSAAQILDQAGAGGHAERILDEFRQELDVLREFF
jgi:putative nucleotidyltransferase with HDIG domain